jgi:hypothetical protein
VDALTNDTAFVSFNYIANMESIEKHFICVPKDV